MRYLSPSMPFAIRCAPAVRRAAAPVLLALAAALAAPGAAGAVADTLAERVKPCAACHGEHGEGLRANAYYPRIAGKPEGYLFNQLVNFRDRRRDVPVMNYLVAYLSDAYLREIAAYYARLPAAHPPSVAAPAALRARGEALVRHGDPARKVPPCSACHGPALQGMAPAIPPLAGLDAKYVAAQMGAWRSARRSARAPDCMARVARRLDPADIAALTAWIASRDGAAGARPLTAGALEPPLECGGLDAAPDRQAAASPAPLRPDAARGAYLVAAANCRSCHTVPGGIPFAGGRAIRTPFGTLYGPNLTPDPETGLGRWSAGEFRRALHQGIGRDGELLYPAFPYTHYTKLARADVDAMYAYLRTLAPVRRPNRPPEMRFPYGERGLLRAWRALYFDAGRFVPDPARPAAWNRGAYLVEGLGHCRECHAPRNAWGAVEAHGKVPGGLIPVLDWYAPPLTAPRESGLGRWAPEEVAALLRTGVSSRGAVFGPMAEVVRDSLQHLEPADVRAIVAYLDAQRAPGGKVRVAAPKPAPARMRSGERIYRERCADCHGRDGKGAPGAYPPLAGNEAILVDDAVNAIRITLNGGYPPSTAGNPRPYGMPPFAHVLADGEVADVVSYMRTAWGNAAAAVAAPQVARARGVPLD